MLYKLESIESYIDDLPCPDLETNSIHHDLETLYRISVLSHLKEIITTHRQNSLVLVNTLKQFLDEHWSLINGSHLCYTARPNHPITKLLCDVAGYVTQEINKNQPENEALGIIQILMPTVGTLSASDYYPDLAPSASNNFTEVIIDRVLQTHILGRGGKVLIPIQIITEYDDTVGFKRLAHPYFDYKNHSDDMAFLNDEETRRLVEHSAITHDLFDAKTAFEAYANDQSNLLGHLRLLITQLQYNSVNGIGAERSAGNGVYANIYTRDLSKC